MWLFFNDAFLSIISENPRSKDLTVRGRIKGDIQRVFPGAKVIETPVRDYRFRAFIPRERVAQVVARNLLDLEYHNFKGSVREMDRHDQYLKVWGIMHSWQARANHPKRSDGEWEQEYLLPVSELEDEFDRRGRVDNRKIPTPSRRRK